MIDTFPLLFLRFDVFFRNLFPNNGLRPPPSSHTITFFVRSSIISSCRTRPRFGRRRCFPAHDRRLQHRALLWLTCWILWMLLRLFVVAQGNQANKQEQLFSAHSLPRNWQFAPLGGFWYHCFMQSSEDPSPLASCVSGCQERSVPWRPRLRSGYPPCWRLFRQTVLLLC